MSDFFSDVHELIEASPLWSRGTFVLHIRYAVSDNGVLFELIFTPEGDKPKFVAKWIFDLLKIAQAGETHRDLVQKGLDSIYEAYKLRGPVDGLDTPA
jgi:hypothetical protein